MTTQQPIPTSCLNQKSATADDKASISQPAGRTSNPCSFEGNLHLKVHKDFNFVNCAIILIDNDYVYSSFWSKFHETCSVLVLHLNSKKMILISDNTIQEVQISVIKWYLNNEQPLGHRHSKLILISNGTRSLPITYKMMIKCQTLPSCGATLLKMNTKTIFRQRAQT